MLVFVKAAGSQLEPDVDIRKNTYTHTSNQPCSVNLNEYIPKKQIELQKEKKRLWGRISFTGIFIWLYLYRTFKQQILATAVRTF